MLRVGPGDLFLWAVFPCFAAGIAGMVSCVLSFSGIPPMEVCVPVVFMWAIAGGILGWGALLLFNILTNRSSEAGKAVLLIHRLWGGFALVAGSLVGLFVYPELASHHEVTLNAALTRAAGSAIPAFAALKTALGVLARIGDE